MALAQADTVKLEEFLGFPFLTWLRDLPLPSLHQLSRFLLTEKLVNWAMLRTVTNLLDISPEFRSLLSANQQKDFADVEASIRKPGREAVVWNQAVCYLLFRNLRRLLSRLETICRKIPELDAVRRHEFSRLKARLSGNIFLTALQRLAQDKRMAFACFSALGSHRTALALNQLPALQLDRMLRESVSENFLKDVQQLRQGEFLHFSEYNIMASQDRLVDLCLKSTTDGRMKLAQLLPAVLALPAAARHLCLYDANLIDLGYAIAREQAARPLLAELAAKASQSYSQLVLAAAEGRLKINHTDPDSGHNLAVQYYRLKLTASPAATTDRAST
ncbi:MAG: hypothetical protein A2087_04245 [Spirochaetes bacterium GWD1_61_31]|nr:MAG: hypothetical protein A2Y37_10810 [Spirochaetes bacterium GWB1_60_80]OHD29413.1 MAG: hypothetical protein A2004_03805 [Spirochaetes bacterium GWC1_61_12]OHD35420.1 MAG: hypothetical protein A2087_04245 [Spirochaetes bacterium GWD1_61_31]OHD44929.1 MAG: hypothetical protein A2Y35_12850 [Spirochaetes bacterium GWE1_60_18]OHD60039.1 MAG: hypothetical protein A2Y32_10965 [Spirochaetes bacterium GWF1_60_12]HAP43599.1 hypothetical protein [Spirochaetaceae bacterium]